MEEEAPSVVVQLLNVASQPDVFGGQVFEFECGGCKFYSVPNLFWAFVPKCRLRAERCKPPLARGEWCCLQSEFRSLFESRCFGLRRNQSFATIGGVAKVCAWIRGRGVAPVERIDALLAWLERRHGALRDLPPSEMRPDWIRSVAPIRRRLLAVVSPAPIASQTVSRPLTRGALRAALASPRFRLDLKEIGPLGRHLGNILEEEVLVPMATCLQRFAARLAPHLGLLGPWKPESVSETRAKLSDWNSYVDGSKGALSLLSPENDALRSTPLLLKEVDAQSIAVISLWSLHGATKDAASPPRPELVNRLSALATGQILTLPNVSVANHERPPVESTPPTVA